MRKKQVLANVLNKTRINRLLLYLRGKLFSELTILAYHRVLDVQNPDAYPFDFDTIDADTENFQWQMETVKRYYTPISMSQLCRHLDVDEPLPARPILITFDDGYNDNYFNAYPILKSLSIPATIFLSTDYINTKIPFWFDWLAYSILNVDAKCFELPLLGIKQPLGQTVADKRAVYDFCVGKMKHVDNQKRLDSLRQIRDQYGDLYSDATDEVQALCRALSWEQCREMAMHNIEFGSHSVSHPILRRLNKEDLEYELRESKDAIERNLRGQGSVNVLAFPNGQVEDYNDEIVKMASLCGYSFCLSYVNGINNLADLDGQVYKRKHIEPKNDKSIFMLSLGVPNI